MAEVESESEVAVGDGAGGAGEDESLPHAAIRAASIDDSPAAKDERETRI